MLGACHLKNSSVIVETLVSVAHSFLNIDSRITYIFAKKKMLVAILVKEKRITHRANLDTSV